MDRRRSEHLLGHPQGGLLLMGRRRQRGMSIIEIMVAIAIVAMMLMLAAPSAKNWIQNTQLRGAAESVLTGIQTARLEALKRNTLIRFELTDAASTEWRICIYDPINDACSAAANAVLTTKSGAEGGNNARFATDSTQSNSAVALAPGTSVPASVTFDSFGRFAPTAPNNFMRVDVRNPVLAAADERRLVIYLGVGGQVRMCDPKLTKATNPQGCA